MQLKILFALTVIIRTASFYQVHYTLKNSTSQSRIISPGDLAIDGNLGTCAISGRILTVLAWWRVKLDKEHNIDKIIVSYRVDEFYRTLMNHFKAYISSSDDNPEANLCTSYYGSKRRVLKEKRSYVKRESGTVTLNCVQSVLGSSVTIKRFGGPLVDWLVLCEVMIFALSDQLAINRPTQDGGMFFKDLSPLAVDGNNSTCARVFAKVGVLAWWRVVLDDIYAIDKIVIYFNPNAVEPLKFGNVQVFVSSNHYDFEKSVCAVFSSMTESIRTQGFIELPCEEPKPKGIFITIKKTGGDRANVIYGLCEVEVYSANMQLTNKVCKIGEVRCKELETCLPPENKCDKVRQCPDGRDELSCPCEHHEYGCKFGHCIPRDWLCDKISDCPLEDDEIFACGNCTKDKFECDAGKVCIFLNQRCDGVYDCYDRSDEENCFYFQDFFLKAIYKGDPDFYVCSATWVTRNSDDVCDLLFASIADSTKYDKINDGKLKSIQKIEMKGFYDGIPDISVFKRSLSCPGRLYVRIYCIEENKDPRKICGTRGFPDNATGPYIINGNLAKPGAWPWHVQVLVDGFYVCGGSLIKQNWVLTAAHCLTVVNSASQVTIKVGTNLYNDPLAPEISTMRIITHPEYDDSTKNHDIGLIKLATLLKITDLVKPICLPDNKWEWQRQFFRYCVLSGFGAIDRSKNSPKYLLQGRMNIMTIDECAKNLEKTGTLFVLIYKNELETRPIFCAGSYPSTHGINSCKGDSGSPLVCKHKRTGIWYQYGVVSYGEDGGYLKTCTNSVFAKVYEHVGFIRDNIFR